MRKKSVSIVFFCLFMFFSLLPNTSYAIEDPRLFPNNKIGIHILATSELEEAAKLINSNGGDWGYVTIPIRVDDKDVGTWQQFMDECRKFHLIPLLRLSTSPDIINSNVWRKPTPSDIIGLAYFLDSLRWPTKNRYLIVFNEVNRGNEWGGSVNPAEYAEILTFAVTVFKSRNPDYFLISSGMDNAAPQQFPRFMNQYTYMRDMNAAVPGIFNQIDGISSHSYPNPGFSQPPNTISRMGTGSFKYEQNLVQELTMKKLPIFITETGWTGDLVSDELRARYYQQAITTVWNDPNIIAITPFLLHANGGPFEQFSFLGPQGNLTKQYEMLQGLPKNQGEPTLEKTVLSASIRRTAKPTHTPKPKRVKPQTKNRDFSLPKMFQNVVEWLSK